MVKRRIRRAGAGLAFIAVVLLLSACGGGDSVDEKESRGSSRGDSSQTTTQGNPRTLVVHLTGLLLLVPSSQEGKVMNVLIPHVPQHNARLVFGMNTADPKAQTLCVGKKAENGICHVNLVEWQVDALGTGGNAPPPGSTLPKGILNVTRLSNGPHKANPSQAARQVTLAAGWAAPNACRLANWSHNQPDEGPALVNVLTWEIENPANLQLVFTRPNVNEPPVIVPLFDENGRAEILLAHVHNDELPHLPPNKATKVVAGSQHFRWYYTVLAPPPPNRPEPQNPDPIDTLPCPVKITTHSQFRDEPSALGTYACMIATAEG